MSVLDTLLAPLGYAKARKLDKAPTVYRVMADDAQPWPDYAVMKNQARAYKQSETTFFCVNLKAKTASSYEFMVSKRVSGEEGLESIPNHPLEMLIQRPNVEMQLTRQMLWISTISHICIHGNAYWYLAFNNKGEPEKIIPLRPDRVRIVPDAVKYVKGYTYTNAGQELALEPWEVVHFRNFHVSDDWYGLSDIEAGASSLEGDIHSAAEFNASLRNRGVPAMLVASKVNVVPDKWERFKREWRAQYDGYDNAGKTAFLENGQIEVTPVSVPMRDLQRLEMREYTSEQLMRVHGVPPAMYAKNAIDANATAQGRYFLRTAIRPLHVLIAETVTNQVALPFFGEELVCDFENCVTEDEALKLQEMRVVTEGIVTDSGTRTAIMTRDEFRKQYFGLDPLPEPEEPEPQPVQLVQQPQQAQNAESEGQPVPQEERVESRPDDEARDEMKAADLRRWKAKALKALKTGLNPGERDFISQWIPEDEHDAIREALDGAESAEAVKAAFAEPVIAWAKDEPLPPVPDEVVFTDRDQQLAEEMWDRFVPEAAGMLSAEVINKRDFDENG